MLWYTARHRRSGACQRVRRKEQCTGERHDLRYGSATESLGRGSRPRAAGAVYTTPLEAPVAPVELCNECRKSHSNIDLGACPNKRFLEDNTMITVVSGQKRAVAYLRRSVEFPEHSLIDQLQGALRKAAALGVSLHASTADLQYLRQRGEHGRRGVFVDDGRIAKDVARPGLQRLLEAVETDRSIPHVLVSSPDRLTRCETELREIVAKLRAAGVTPVFTDGC